MWGLGDPLPGKPTPCWHLSQPGGGCQPRSARAASGATLPVEPRHPFPPAHSFPEQLRRLWQRNRKTLCWQLQTPSKANSPAASTGGGSPGRASPWPAAQRTAQAEGGLAWEGGEEVMSVGCHRGVWGQVWPWGAGTAPHSIAKSGAGLCRAPEEWGSLLPRPPGRSSVGSVGHSPTGGTRPRGKCHSVGPCAGTTGPN